MTRRYTFADLAALDGPKKVEADSHASDASTTEPEQKEFPFMLTRKCEARVILTGTVTQEAIAKLCAVLELSKDTFPTQAELDDLESPTEG